MTQKSETEIALHQISLDIEQAIETVRGFTPPAKGILSRTSLVNPAIQNKKQDLSPLEKTLCLTKNCLMSIFSTTQKQETAQDPKTIKGGLQQSLNLLKIYSSALTQVQKDFCIDKTLAESVLTSIHNYNSLLRESRNPISISGKIKYFFLRMAGWTIDEEWRPREIPIPAIFQRVSNQTESLLNHKITFKQETAESKKITEIVQTVRSLQDKEQTEPKKHEIDAFRLKALLLLEQQEMTDKFCLEEIIHSIHHTPIEPTLIDSNGIHILELHQVISDFPGEEIEIKGLFRRDNTFSGFSIPVKESFQLTKSTHQSGFPHPLQYTGMAFSEMLIPQGLHDSTTEFEGFLQTKRELAEQLLPTGKFNKKAKMLLNLRRSLFEKNPSLLQLQKMQMQALVQEAESEIINIFFDQLTSFETLGKVHEQINQHVTIKPISLINTIADIKDPEKYRSMLEAEIDRMIKLFSDKTPLSNYQSLIGLTIGKAIPSLYLLQLSKPLNFSPPVLTNFEKTMLTSLFRQQLVFADEVQNFPDNVCPLLFEEYLIEQIEEETALFKNIPSSEPLTQTAKSLTNSLLEVVCV